MTQCRLTDPDAGAADSRMGAYLEGQHHPQQALPPRVAYVALADDVVVGYVAGHLTRRFECDGELQYLFVAAEGRRRGIASDLLRLLAGWFLERGAIRVCVDVDRDSAGAEPFYSIHGASTLNEHWCVWENVGVLLTPDSPQAASVG